METNQSRIFRLLTSERSSRIRTLASVAAKLASVALRLSVNAPHSVSLSDSNDWTVLTSLSLEFRSIVSAVFEATTAASLRSWPLFSCCRDASCCFSILPPGPPSPPHRLALFRRCRRAAEFPQAQGFGQIGCIPFCLRGSGEGVEGG